MLTEQLQQPLAYTPKLLFSHRYLLLILPAKITASRVGDDIHHRRASPVIEQLSILSLVIPAAVSHQTVVDVGLDPKTIGDPNLKNLDSLIPLCYLKNLPFNRLVDNNQYNDSP